LDLKCLLAENELKYPKKSRTSVKGLSVILAIIVMVLWLGSATYIAAPANVLSKLPTPPMGNVPPAFLGVLLFLFSIVFIVLWAGWTPEKSVPDENKTAEIKQ
jgi:hypothetical protein